jgi:hypothetical protein
MYIPTYIKYGAKICSQFINSFAATHDSGIYCGCIECFISVHSTATIALIYHLHR